MLSQPVWIDHAIMTLIRPQILLSRVRFASMPRTTRTTPSRLLDRERRLIGVIAPRDQVDSQGIPPHFAYMRTAAKNTENRPSITIMRKIDLTTEEVVWNPSDSALPCTA